MQTSRTSFSRARAYSQCFRYFRRHSLLASVAVAAVFLAATESLAQNDPTAPLAATENTAQLAPANPSRPDAPPGQLMTAEETSRINANGVAVHNRIVAMGAAFAEADARQKAVEQQLAQHSGFSRFLLLLRLGLVGRALREYPIVASLGLFLVLSALGAFVRSIFKTRV
jgi:hypothetical protein